MIRIRKEAVQAYTNSSLYRICGFHRFSDRKIRKRMFSSYFVKRVISGYVKAERKVGTNYSEV